MFLPSASKNQGKLTPKDYCLETINKELIFKVKGLSHEIELTMNDYNHLLYKETSIIKNQIK